MDTDIVYKFRRKAFGGFNRKDVADYIEKAMNESNRSLESARVENERLNDSISQLERQIAELNAKNADLEGQLTKALEENAALSAAMEELKTQAEAPEPTAKEAIKLTAVKATASGKDILKAITHRRESN